MFYVFAVTNLIVAWCFEVFLATIADYGLDKGLSDGDLVTILACFSVADLVGSF